MFVAAKTGKSLSASQVPSMQRASAACLLIAACLLTAVFAADASGALALRRGAVAVRLRGEAVEGGGAGPGGTRIAVFVTEGHVVGCSVIVGQSRAAASSSCPCLFPVRTARRPGLSRVTSLRRHVRPSPSASRPLSGMVLVFHVPSTSRPFGVTSLGRHVC